MTARAFATHRIQRVLSARPLEPPHRRPHERVQAPRDRFTADDYMAIGFFINDYARLLRLCGFLCQTSRSTGAEAPRASSFRVPFVPGVPDYTRG
jgi:hypothetical protein